jgi:YVTN family beta-propeller protein
MARRAGYRRIGGTFIRFGAPCLAMTSNGRTLYVVNGDSGTVTPISTATNRPGRPVRVGLSPVDIAITP